MKRTAILFILSLISAFTAASGNPLRQALNPEWIEIKEANEISGDQRLVLMIGENHPIVAGQIHLADQLRRLLDAKLIDAVLVEGSPGPIDPRLLTEPAARLLATHDLATYWRRKLEWGQLTGWEYLALTRPETTVHGVEDMGAKKRFEIRSTLTSVKRTAGPANRGAERLEAAVSALELAGLPQPEMRRALVRHRKELHDLTAAAESLVAAYEPALAKELQLLDVELQLMPIFKDTGLGKAKTDEQVRTVLAGWSQSNPELLARFLELNRKAQTLESELKAPGERLQPAARVFADRSDRVVGSYRAAANRLRTEAEQRWGKGTARPPAVARSLQAVENFFRDEEAWERKQVLVWPRAELAERDHAMAANTHQFLRDHSAKRVALIVGFAHLVGIADELRGLGVPFVTGALRPLNGEEPWEFRAWKQNKASWAAGVNQNPSLILSPSWRGQQITLLQKFGNGDSQAGFVDGSRAVHRSALLPDQRVSRGGLVVSAGPVPGHPGEVFEEYDRDLGQQQVKEESDGFAEMIYAPWNLDAQGRPEYDVYSRYGHQTLKEFQMRPPGNGAGSSPRYYVFASEPNFQKDGREVLWAQMRGPNGIGGPPSPPRIPTPGAAPDGGAPKGKTNGRGAGTPTKPPSPPPPSGGRGSDGPSDPRWTGFFYAHKSKDSPALLRTTDIRRSRVNLEKLKQQKPLNPSEVVLLRGLGQLDSVYFTEDDGSHTGMVVITAKNTAELRAAVRKAASLGKLANKQVALITCGDLARQNALLREDLLVAGALMVWTPDRQITVQTGEQLTAQVEATLAWGRDNNWHPRDINQLLERAIADLQKSKPGSPELRGLWESGAWVELVPVHRPAFNTGKEPGPSDPEVAS
jgi:hypothetical protein